MRVHTYLTLLASLALASALGRPSPALEAHVRRAWASLNRAERQRVAQLIQRAATALQRKRSDE